MKTDILDGGPDNRQATGLGREHVNLVSALSHIADEDAISPLLALHPSG